MTLNTHTWPHIWLFGMRKNNKKQNKTKNKKKGKRPFLFWVGGPSISSEQNLKISLEMLLIHLQGCRISLNFLRHLLKQVIDESLQHKKLKKLKKQTKTEEPSKKGGRACVKHFFFSFTWP